MEIESTVSVATRLATTAQRTVLAPAINDRITREYKPIDEKNLHGTELARLAEELQIRNQQLESFSHVVSHDLRQPLGSILNYLELLADSESLDPRAYAWIEAARGIGNEMQKLISDILEFSILGAKTPEMAPVDSNRVMNTVRDSLYDMLEESGALLTSDSLPQVLGAETLLTAVFQNIISNAIKYRSKSPPVIHVSCQWSREDDKWLFCVSDNGRGFKSEECEELFHMFSRSPDVSGIGGLGIGLAVCRQIVEAHGGRIWARPKQGNGAEFFFLLVPAGRSKLQQS